MMNFPQPVPVNGYIVIFGCSYVGMAEKLGGDEDVAFGKNLAREGSPENMKGDIFGNTNPLPPAFDPVLRPVYAPAPSFQLSAMGNKQSFVIIGARRQIFLDQLNRLVAEKHCPVFSAFSANNRLLIQKIQRVAIQG